VEIRDRHILTPAINKVLDNKQTNCPAIGNKKGGRDEGEV